MGPTANAHPASTPVSAPPEHRVIRRHRSAGIGLLLCLAAVASGCTTHHWAEVKTSKLPPSPGDRVVHTGRLLISVTDKTDETQCVVYKKYSPVCFYNVRPSIEQGLVRGLWPSFPEVIVAEAEAAQTGDYVLEVEFELDALPPDGTGPGWSAGVRGRYRLLRDREVLDEATLSSRSRADLPYGAPLGLGATDVVDAALVHITAQISAFPETRPDDPIPLPMVAVNQIKKGPSPKTARAPAPAREKEDPSLASGPGAIQAKSAPVGPSEVAAEDAGDPDQLPAPPPSLAP